MNRMRTQFVPAMLVGVAGLLASCSGDRVAAPDGAAALGGGTAAVAAQGQGGRSLAVAVAPAGAIPGQPFATQPQVAFFSAQGKLLPVGERVSVSVAGGGTTLGGTTSVAAKLGVASFTDLSIADAGTWTLTFSAPGASPVNATVTVATPTVCKYAIRLLDAGTSNTVSASGTSAQVGAAGGSFEMEVTTNLPTCTWTPVSNSTWISVADPTPHTGNATIAYTVDVLPHSAAERSGRIELWNPFPTLNTGVGGTITQVH